MIHRMKMRSKEEIEREIKNELERSDDCPYCTDECWCDGDWSPAAHLHELRTELAAAKRRTR